MSADERALANLAIRLDEVALASGKPITESLGESIRSLVHEVERLRQWKAEATEVMDGLQEVGKALGTPPGRRITGRETVDLALDLRNEVSHLRSLMSTNERTQP